ncbi:MAG: hypothetical protein KF745_01525 [Phycisphaeraceae bacterium]|nr:hypothetical protein [Phycisphaeraceae bacterium]
MTIRYAIVCDPKCLRQWHARCIEELLAVAGPTCIGVLARGSRARPDGAWSRFERRIASVPGSAMAPAQGSPTKALDVLDDAGVAGADLLVVLGSIDDRHLPSPPRLGVWAFSHDRPDSFPVGLGPMLRGEHVVQISLVRIDNGSTVHTGASGVIAKSYPRTLDAALLGSAGFAARALREAMVTGQCPRVDRPAVQEAKGDPDAALPQLRRMTRAARIRDAAKWLFRHEQWGVGVADRPISDFLGDGELPPIRWLPRSRRSHFIADPFARRRGDTLWILVEEYEAREARGVLSIVQWRDGGLPAPPRRVMEQPVHLSYPFLVDDGDEIYCIPETGEAREAALYRADPFPDRWVKVCTLVEGPALLDPTVVRHEGTWWLFGSIEERERVMALHAWHAEHLEGPWKPHGLNPLKSDIRSSRPAGTPFMHAGRLYRPAQDGSREYGGAVAICEVESLTPAAFRERVVRVVRPDPRGPYPCGLHTLSGVDSQTVIDGKRRVFVPMLCARQLATLARKAFGVRG